MQGRARPAATGSPSFIDGKRLQITGNGLHVLIGKQVCDLLHRRIRPSLRGLEYVQLLQRVVLVLTRQPGKVRDALSLGSMASHTGSGFLFRNTFFENLPAGGHFLRVDCGVGLRNLLGEVVGESLDLIVGELVAYAPHVDETRWVGTLVASEVFQLGDEVTWLLTGEPRKVGRYRVAVETVAD